MAFSQELVIPVTASLGPASVCTGSSQKRGPRSLPARLQAKRGLQERPQVPAGARVGAGPALRDLTFPLATALHLNLRLASARRRASWSSLAKVQCRFWLLLWYMVQP